MSIFLKTNTNLKKNIVNRNLLQYCLIDLLFFKKMLRIVKNIYQNRQLLSAKCFIIHVGSICIGEKTYA